MRSFIGKYKSWRANCNKRRQQRVQWKAALEALTLWCNPGHPPLTKKSQALWAAHSIVAVQVLVPQTRNPQLWQYTHLSFFSALGMEQYVPAWCELLLLKHSRLVQGEDDTHQFIRWCHIQDAGFWKTAGPFIGTRYGFMWDTIMYEAACIGNMQALLAAGPTLLEAFARKQYKTAYTHPLFELDWLPAHPNAALYFVEQGWWPRAILPEVAQQSTSFEKKRAMGAGPSSPFVSPSYLATWVGLMLERMELSDMDKAGFLIEFVHHVGLPCWSLFMHRQCRNALGNIHFDVAWALAGIAFAQAKVHLGEELSISEQLYGALGALRKTTDGYGFAVDNQTSYQYPALALMLHERTIENAAQLYALAIGIKRAELGEYAEEYCLPP